MSAVKNSVLKVQTTFRAICFVAVEGEFNKEKRDNRRKAVLSSPDFKAKNERDIETLVNLFPEVYDIKGIKLALFEFGKETSLKRDEHYDEELTNKLRRALDAHRRLGRVYGYKLTAVFKFEGENISEDFTNFISALMTKHPNTLVITDDKLYYLYAKGIIDKEILRDSLISERMVLLQPFEYTEQIIKLNNLPGTDARTGSLVMITYYSPLLKLNGFKAKYRRIMKEAGGNAGTSKNGVPFVSFQDEAIDDILREMRINVMEDRVSKDVEKLFKMILIVTSLRVFPILASYSDYAGLYGASQILRGYTADEYSRVEDFESKLDLMLRGHLNKKYHLSSSVATDIILRYTTNAHNEMVRNARKTLRKILPKNLKHLADDEILPGLLLALVSATKTRKEMTADINHPDIDDIT